MSRGTLLRGALGGLLMGLANLVPGISGGTMLLATGVYTRFVDAIAEVTTFRFRPASLIMLGTIGGVAAGAILLLAGPTKTLVMEQRWIMYSLFIGLTLGGVPLVWRRARPVTRAVHVSALVAFGLMAWMAFGASGARDGSSNTMLLLLAGAAGASAMILPGVSGGYLLLLLGQYEPILGAIDTLKLGLLATGGPDLELVFDAMRVVIPVGIGVVVGIVGVSNLIHWLLEHYRKATLGALLGLLFGAVVGLWPFQQAVPPQPGDVVKGRTLDAETAALVPPKHWPLQRFAPAPGQVVGAFALIGIGLGATLAIARLGDDEGESESDA